MGSGEVGPRVGVGLETGGSIVVGVGVASTPESMVTVLLNVPRSTLSPPNTAAVGVAPQTDADVEKATVVTSLMLAARKLMVARVNWAVGSPPVNCCQSAKVGQIGTRENCCYGEAALSFLTVRL